jgi:hypothetical protein
MGHIINLTVQAFLFDNDDSETSISLQPTEAETDTWCAKGALGKLHNIVVFVQRSPQRIAAFIELSGGKKLERDNSTWWNSWAHMIACALRLDIRRVIKIFCQEFQLDEDALNMDDWVYIQAVRKLLEIFEQVKLDPRVKWVYFTKQWSDWITQAKQDILTYWNEFYKGSHTGIDHQAQALNTDQSEISKFRRQNNPQDDEVVDQYELYCITPRLPERSKQ